MFDLSFRFGTHLLLALFLSVVLVGVLAAVRFWGWLLAGRRLWYAAFFAFLLHSGLLLTWSVKVGVDQDEVEHLHCAWLVSQGLIPYRDFWQNHSPTLWYLLAPLVAQFHSPALLVAGRLLAGFLFLLTAASGAWLAWRAYRERAAAVLAALVVVAFGAQVQGTLLRPDQLANLGCVLALVLVCSEAVRLRASFAAGVLLGFGLSLTPKPLGLAPAFPILVFASSAFRQRERYAHLLSYLLGLAAGVLPLFVLLWKRRILEDWVVWTLLRQAPGTGASQTFPAVPALIAGVSCVRALSKDRNDRVLLVSTAFLLQTLVCLLIPYGLGVDVLSWIVLASVLAGGVLAHWIRESAAEMTPPEKRRRLAALSAASILLLLAPTFIEPLRDIQNFSAGRFRSFASDRALLAWMIEEAGSGPVALVAPVHTIFSRDATGLYHWWQYAVWITDPQVAASLRGFAERLIQARPSLIAFAPERYGRRPPFFELLTSAKIITPQEKQSLEKFVLENYVVQEYEGEKFYVLQRK